MHASINFLGFARPRARARFGVFLAAVAFAASGADSHATDGKSLHSWGGDGAFVVSTTPAGVDFVAIAAGNIHSVALKTDGSIEVWGDNLWKQISDKPEGTGFTAISAAGYHSMALKDDGSIVVWGADDYDQVTDVPEGGGFKAVAAGYGHNLALKEDGSIAAWGWDSFGQVGETPAGTGFKAIAAGSRHNLAIAGDGSLVAWGWDDFGLTAVPAGDDFVAVAAGVRYSLALRADGTLVMWGDETDGLIANMPTGDGFVSIAAGDAHFIALKADGSLVSWSQDEEFGGDSHGIVSDTPIVTGFVAMAAGSGHSIVLRHVPPGHPLTGWGINNIGQSSPPEGSDFQAVSSGGDFGVALRTDGVLQAWGHNSEGQVSLTPTGGGFEEIAAGGFHGLALRTNGRIVAWGRNVEGQSSVPEGNDFVAISAGIRHSLALKFDGTIVGWGQNTSGQATPPAGDGHISIAAGWNHSLALKSDGSVVGWGDNTHGQSASPAGSDFVAIAAGDNYSLALRENGTIVAWGQNTNDKASPPPGSYVAISAGKAHGLAVTSTGGIVAWGTDFNNKVSGKPAGSGFVDVSAGFEHSLALGPAAADPSGAPVPTITSPSNGATFLPNQPITISHTLVGDTSALDRVEIWKKSGAETEYTYFFEFSRNPSTGKPFSQTSWELAPNGGHSLRLRAVNTGGQFADSVPVSITVGSGLPPPTPTITSPANNAVLNSSTPITIQATISGDIGALVRVEFFANSAVLGAQILGEVTSTAATEYSFTWTEPLPGEYDLTARAVNVLGGVVASASVTIKVEGRAVPVFVSPADGTKVFVREGVELEIQLLGDISGLQRVQFFEHMLESSSDSLLGEVDSPPYTFLVESIGFGAHRYIPKAVYADGETTTGPSITVSAVGSCFAEALRFLLGLVFGGGPSAGDAMRQMLANVLDLDLDLLRQFRDEVLQSTPAGRFYTDLYDRVSPSLVRTVLQNPSLVQPAYNLMIEWSPVIQAIVDGNGDAIQITDEMAAHAIAVLDQFRAVAGADVLAILDAEEAALDPSTWAGLTGAELLARGESQVRPAPGIASQPASRAIAASGRVSFFVAAGGAGPFNYQWRRNGVAIAGATGATLELTDVQAAGAGIYSVVVSNPFGSTESSAATLTVNTAARLINLSARAFAGAGEATLVLGFYIDGTGSKTVLIRGIGPKLLDFNVPSVVEDPSIVVYKEQTPLDSNDDWDPALAADFPLVGAFELDPGSKDAALKITLPPGGYTVHLVNNGSAAEALIEVYDFSKDAGTRLVNLSCRLNISVGEIVIVGTSLINNPVPVVVRNAGPALGAHNVTGHATDTRLRVYAGQTEIAANIDWDETLEPDFAAVGAFSFTRGSKDAALRVPLTQGGITVHATVVDDNGIALIEIYEGK